MGEVSVTVTGIHYSDNKRALKDILAEFDFKWQGNYAANDYVWRCKSGTIRNEYERDPVNDVNLCVKITYRGKDGKFKQKLFTWAASGLYVQPKSTQEDLAKLDEDYRQRLVNLHREINANLLGTALGATIFYRITVKEWLHKRQEILGTS